MKSPEMEHNLVRKITRRAAKPVLCGLAAVTLLPACSSSQTNASDLPPKKLPDTLPATTIGAPSQENPDNTTTTITPTTSIEVTTSTTAEVEVGAPDPSSNIIYTTDFRRRTYDANTCKYGSQPWQAKDGIASQPSTTGEDLPAELYIGDVVLGDINNDGKEDALVLMDCRIVRTASYQVIGVYAGGTALNTLGLVTIPENDLAKSVSPFMDGGGFTVEELGGKFQDYTWTGSEFKMTH